MRTVDYSFYYDIATALNATNAVVTTINNFETIANNSFLSINNDLRGTITSPIFSLNNFLCKINFSIYWIKPSPASPGTTGNTYSFTIKGTTFNDSLVTETIDVTAKSLNTASQVGYLSFNLTANFYKTISSIQLTKITGSSSDTGLVLLVYQAPDARSQAYTCNRYLAVGNRSILVSTFTPLSTVATLNIDYSLDESPKLTEYGLADFRLTYPNINWTTLNTISGTLANPINFWSSSVPPLPNAISLISFRISAINKDPNASSAFSMTGQILENGLGI